MTLQQPDIQWYIARDGKQHGPLSDVEMRTFVATRTSAADRSDLARGLRRLAAGTGGLSVPVARAAAPGVQPPSATPLRPRDPQPDLPSEFPADGFPANGIWSNRIPQERSFEPERIRGASRRTIWASRIVGGLVVLLLIAGGGGWFLWQKGGIAQERSRSIGRRGNRAPSGDGADHVASLRRPQAFPRLPEFRRIRRRLRRRPWRKARKSSIASSSRRRCGTS